MAKHSKEESIRKRQEPAGYAFVLPTVIFLAIFVLYPLIYNLIISFQNVDIMSFLNPNKQYVGWANYAKVVQSKVFPVSLWNTFFFTVVNLLIQFPLGLLLAIFFSKKFRFAEPLRGLMVVAWMIPMVATAGLWKWMLDTNGILNYIMVSFHLISSPIHWLTSESTAMWGVIFTNSWVGIPFNMVLLATGLSTLPESVYEAASIDGANNWQRFWLITLPLLRPSIISVLTLGFIYTFKVFDLVYVMTGGGPVNATEVLSTFSYRLSFTDYQFSQGSAVANILFVILVGIGILNLWLTKDEEVAH